LARLAAPEHDYSFQSGFFQGVGCTGVSLLCLYRGARQNGADCENQSL
jgi:hypothetical protein